MSLDGGDLLVGGVVVGLLVCPDRYFTTVNVISCGFERCPAAFVAVMISV